MFRQGLPHLSRPGYIVGWSTVCGVSGLGASVLRRGWHIGRAEVCVV
jgi:hypothetical protein